MRLIVTILGLCLCCVTTAQAANPTGYGTLITRIFDNMQSEMFDRIDTMYDARFVDFTVSQDETINKTQVYYDATKVLYDIYELTNDTSGLTAGQIALRNQIPSYIDKANQIIAQRYIQSTVGGGGYMAYPHGLWYHYQRNQDQTSWDAMIDLRNEGNFMTMSSLPLGVSYAREGVDYVRDDIYSLQTGLYAMIAGVTVSTSMDNAALVDGYLEYALSHLNQWATGNFDPIGTYGEYRSSFMVGLCAAGLIEYYELYEQDSRIPAAIKTVLDQLWAQNWVADITDGTPAAVGDDDSYVGFVSGGAFWTWSDWITDQYVIDPDHNTNSIDVSPTHNSIIGLAYAWYGNYSGDSSYLDKADDIFYSIAVNVPAYNPTGGFWEGLRYVYEMVKYYRSGTGSTCAAATIEQCSAQSTCEAAGGNWAGNWCQHGEVLVVGANIFQGAQQEPSPGAISTGNTRFGGYLIKISE